YAQAIFSSARRLTEPLSASGVALMAGGRVGVGPDVESAARALATAQAPAAAEARDGDPLAAARAAFAALDSAARRSDWAGFARAMEALRRALAAGGRTP
ncbi:MAG: hypothetical protein ABSB58_12155, partial [Gemmatimonadales bacterium]